MHHESHSTIFRPTLLIVVTYYVLIIWIWILCQKPKNKLTGLVLGELVQNVNVIDISHIYSNWMFCLSLNGFKKHKLVFICNWTRNLICPIKP
jgi:hypothetical protein